MNIRSCLSFLPTLGLGGPQEWADRSDNLAVPKARCNWGVEGRGEDTVIHRLLIKTDILYAICTSVVPILYILFNVNEVELK